MAKRDAAAVTVAVFQSDL